MRRLRDRIGEFLSAQQVGVLTVPGGQGAGAMPVRYRVNNLELDCLLPRWSDVAWYLDQDSGAATMVIMLSSPGAPLHWLQYRGHPQPVADPDWGDLLPSNTSKVLAGEMYLIIRLIPERIDLVDESRGWGARETLEMNGGA